ncbi:MAG: hypothetical protein OXF79_27870 [Chloroflexi bacterium]|nr:hypothetical protein [Chloroflexota bacterium]
MASAFVALAIMVLLTWGTSLVSGLADMRGVLLGCVAGCGALLVLSLFNRARLERVPCGQITLLHRRQNELEMALGPGPNWRADSRSLREIAENVADSRARDIWVLVRTRSFGPTILEKAGFLVRPPVLPMRPVYTVAYWANLAWWKFTAALRGGTVRRSRRRPWIVGRQRLGVLLDRGGP